LANVKEHAPLSAGASVDHGVGVETTGEHENRAADRGCCVSTCSRFFFSGGGIHVQRMSKPLEQGGENQVFMVEVEDGFFGRALDSSSDSIQRVTQDWYQKGNLDQVLAWLLLKGMDRHKAMEVLASCSIGESE
jgi:hypothetical protein